MVNAKNEKDKKFNLGIQVTSRIECIQGERGRSLFDYVQRTIIWPLIVIACFSQEQNPPPMSDACATPEKDTLTLIPQNP